MANTQVALVTGANKGIGFEIAKGLAANGYAVCLGARNLDAGQSAASKIGKSVLAAQLDVTDPVSIAATADYIDTKFGRLDVLVNNAGISNVEPLGTPFDQVLQKNKMITAPMSDVRAVFDTNVFGVLSVSQAMLPLLRKSSSACIVNVSSGAGSLTSNANPDNPGRAKFGIYSASKTALNAVTLALAIELEQENIKVNAVCPGFTATDLNNFNGTKTPEEGARHPLAVALAGPNGPTGTFSTIDGVMPW